MAVYKVIQDIEAEDKLLGPLTLKGFIYAGIAMLLAYINFRLVLAGGPMVIKVPVIVLLSMPMLLFTVLALPLGREQPTEVWLLSHLRFMLKPRKRVWNQSGVNELVTITAPKKIQRQLTKSFSRREVRSRLKALALTLDSRGWAVKNVNVNLNSAPEYSQNRSEESDRLVEASNLQQDVPVIDVHASDDMLDELNNPTAQKFDELMKQMDGERRKAIISKVYPNMMDEEEPEPKILESHFAPLERTKRTAGKVIRPEDLKRKRAEAQSHHQNQPVQKMTGISQAAKLELAQSGNDLTVASIASLANRKNQSDNSGSNEVVISLH